MVYEKRRGSRRRCVHIYKHTFVCVEMKCEINCFMGVQTLGHFGYLQFFNLDMAYSSTLSLVCSTKCKSHYTVTIENNHKDIDTGRT